MRLAVTGKSGQVTSAIQSMAGDGLEIIPLGRPEVDLAQPDTILAALEAAKADAVVSAAAYTAVDKAESEPETAFAINRDGAAALAQAAAKLGIPIVHLSTDYVYDGTKDSPYVETDPTGPVSVYGHSKLEGELAVAAATPNHAILRTAWVYSVYGQNFVKTMLRLGETRDSLNVVADQFGCPTAASEIARAVIGVAGKLASDDSGKLRGTFHLAGQGETSWAGFARFIFSVMEEATGKAVTVHDIPTSEYPTPAKRPANSRLSCTKLYDAYGIKLEDWQTSTKSVVRSLLGERPEAE